VPLFYTRLCRREAVSRDVVLISWCNKGRGTAKTILIVLLRVLICGQNRFLDLQLLRQAKGKNKLRYLGVAKWLVEAGVCSQEESERSMLRERARVHGRHQAHSVAELTTQLAVAFLQVSYSLNHPNTQTCHQQKTFQADSTRQVAIFIGLQLQFRQRCC